MSGFSCDMIRTHCHCHCCNLTSFFNKKGDPYDTLYEGNLPFIIILFQWNNCMQKNSNDFNTKCVQSTLYIAATVLCAMRKIGTTNKRIRYGTTVAHDTHSSSSMGKIDKCQCYVIVHITQLCYSM